MISGPEAVARSARSFSECANDSGHYTYIIVISLTFVKCFLEKSSALPGQMGAKFRQNEEDAGRKKKLAGFVRGPAGQLEEQRWEKPEICREFTRRSSPRPAVRLGREALRPSPRPAPGRWPPIRKLLWSGCVSSRYTRPQAKRGEKICRNLPSCKLHLDFRRRIRYNIYVIHTTEYAGVSEWQTRGTQNPLRDFSCLCKKFTIVR